MSNHSKLDRQSFQMLLASAFVVQQSQIGTQSLSAIVEIERLIAVRELELDGVMHLIADRTRSVANATGVAIGLLTGDQLVYRAGSGSAAAYIGKCVLATLTVSADTKASGELLRVENAQTDPRIEAVVCRQFGAQSLLILLIYHDRRVAGLLQVLFSEPHVFQDREVRTYRLMAGLIGEAMSRAAQPQRGENPTAELPDIPRAIERATPENSMSRAVQLQRRENPTAELPDIPRAIEHAAPENSMSRAAQLQRRENPTAELPDIPRAIERATPEMEKSLNERQSMPVPANKPAILQPCAAAPAVTGESPVPRQPAVPPTMIRRGPWRQRQWNPALAAVVAVLVIAWIASGVRRPNSALGPSAPQKPVAIEQQAPSLPAQVVPVKGTSKLQTTPVRVQRASRARTTKKRVRVGENEVEYFGEDVTVRYFTPKPAPHRVRAGENKVAYVGNDVTVRHFTPKPAPAPPAQPVRSAAQPVGGSGSSQR
jgi:GAF domain-containing protein